MSAVLLDSVRRCMSVLPPRLRRRWLMLAPLFAAAAVAETAAAAAIFVAVALMSGAVPAGRLSVRVTSLAAHLHLAVVPAALLTVAAAVIVKNAFVAISNVLRASVMADSMDAAFTRAVDRLLRAPFVWHTRSSTAQLLTHLTSTIDATYRVVVAAAVAIAADVMIASALIAAMIVLTPLPALAASVALVAMLVAGALVMRKPMLRWGHASHDERNQVVAQALSMLSSISEVKSFRREDYFRSRLAAAHRRYAGAFQRHVAVLPMPRLVTETAFVVIAAVTTWMVSDRPNVLPVIAVFAYAGFRIVPSLNRIAFHVDEIRFGRAAVEELSSGAIERIPLEPPSAPAARPRLARSIDLREVSYRYPGTDEDTLREISLSIARGEALGIVGETGAGKTTLLHLLAGLIRPSSGSIEVDGAPLEEWAAAPDCRIGFVPQRIALLDASIRRNIAFGLPDDEIDSGRLAQAATLAQLDLLLERLPDGLETVVGEHGARLSGGERQRIAIARALYVDPDVLLFDEPASALDGDTERRVVDAVAAFRGLKTVVVASHRMETLAHCDRVIRVDGGRVETWQTRAG